jgi:prepilin-type N-terminal cleavage/methylation domain-containing protein
MQASGRHPGRRGFTLIELIVAISVIAILLSLLMPALAMLKRNANKAKTLDLMAHVTTALTHYLADYPVLGADDDPKSKDFADRPLQFLIRNQLAAKKEPYIELELRQTAKGSGPAYEAVDNIRDAEHILDFFPNGGRSNRLQFEIVSSQLATSTRWYTSEVRLISTAGTPNDDKDDLIYEYTSQSGQWELKKRSELKKK